MTGLLPQVDSYGGNPNNGGVTSGAATDLAADVVLIPRNGTTSADADASSGGPPPASAYSRYELRRLTQADPERLYAITMPGNAMEPLIRANDTVLYVPVEDFTGAGLYVLHLDGAPIVILVQRLGGGALELIPANEPTYSREEFLPVPYPEEAEQPRTYRSQRTGLLATIEPVGRVVLYAKPI